nr:multidrug efflux SMR transporter [Paracraurococcus ruber]
MLLAGALDVAWAIAMKRAAGWSNLPWSLAALALLGGFTWLLGKALQAVPLGTAYAVWTGLGAAGTVLAGALLFGEAVTPLRLLGIALVLAGILALKLAPG